MMIESIPEKKKALRREIKMRAAALCAAYCEKADLMIEQKVKALESYQKAKTVFLFVSAFGEPETRGLIQDALQQEKRVGVPKCLEDGIMKVYEIKSMQDLEAGRYGILEPNASCPEIDKKQIDFILVPCVSCDKDKNRLGHGKGYYDRYLQDLPCISCMICRKELMVEKIPIDSFDLRPDILITE